MTTNKAESAEISRIAINHGLTTDEIESVIDSMYSFIRDKVVNLEFKGAELTKEEFGDLKTNFNIPCIGKLCANYYTYKKVNKLK